MSWEPKIKEMNLLVRILTVGFGAGITLAPFGIYVKKKYMRWIELKPNSRFVIHEKIHWKQQLEMLIVPFYLVYFLEWVVRIVLPPWNTAYKDISFEKEASENEINPEYLKTRKPYAWIKYLITK